jgi:pilus assembly protein Flp/PilA
MTSLIVKAQMALEQFKRNQSGASLVEYSLLIGLITVAAVVAIGGIGAWVSTQWGALCTATGATCT